MPVYACMRVCSGASICVRTRLRVCLLSASARTCKYVRACVRACTQPCVPVATPGVEPGDCLLTVTSDGLCPQCGTFVMEASTPT